jgi:hypothetical protein
MAKKSISALAKGKATKTPRTNKSTVKSSRTRKINKNKTEVPKNKTEERDIKAKKKVEELLKDVDLSNPKEKELVVKDASDTPTSKEEKNNLNWLEEQVNILSSENTKLKNDLAIAKDDYIKIHNQLTAKINELKNQPQQENRLPLQSSDTTNQNVLKLFNELQNNYTGNNPEKTPWSTASIKHLLITMTQLFPFLQEHRKF